MDHDLKERHPGVRCVVVGGGGGLARVEASGGVDGLKRSQAIPPGLGDRRTVGFRKTGQGRPPQLLSDRAESHLLSYRSRG